MVNPEATHRLIRVFEAALERPEPERRDYVAQACGADEELERQILAMLDADSAPDDGFLEGLPEPEGGQIWGQYELLEPIGEGGMGRVFRGRHRTIGRAVAIKVLNPELAHEPELVSRFLQEASIVNAVRHPSIIDVTDFIRLESPPRVAYVMELLSGVPLSTPLRDGALASSEVLNIAWQVLDALEAVHDAGVTHRDLKPDNIFVSGDLAAGGSPIKVLDFGVAKVSTSNEHLTATGAILGTPAYMAPEQALGQKVGPPADLYAWAAIVYEMLIGQRLFSGSAASILHQKIAGEAPELHRDGVATELRPLVDLLQKLLSPRPEVRPGARESKQLLRQLGASTGHAAHRTVLAAQAEAFEGFTSRAQAAATSHGGTLVPRAGSVVTVWFDHARRAVDFARELRGRAIDDAASQPLEREARMGIWTGQVYLRDQDLQGAEGLVLDGALRLMSMARPGQTLMSGAAADQARQQASSRPFEWVSHGVYGFAELPVPVELYEPIEPGASAFPAPATAPDAWREGETPATSWRPGPGLSVPGRAGWILRRRLGEGGFGEVWLAEHEELEKAHMFKFCFAAGPRRALAREVALGARLKRALGERTDILPVLESELGDPPYYLEGPYLSGGDLKAWLRAHQPEVSTELRLELVAQAADALAAAHSVGIIHRDIKPSNILIDDAGPSPRVVLADFGVGGLVEDTPDPVALADTVLNGASTLAQAGTVLYMSPERLAGRPASIQSDVYALGVILFQLWVDDLGRAAGGDWASAVDDPILREDLASMLASDPAQRMADAGEVARRIRGREGRREARAQAARREASAARARRFRRIALPVGALLLAFGTVMTVQAQRIAREADRANRAAEAARRSAATASRVSEFLIEMFKVSNPDATNARKISARDLLDRGAARIQAELKGEPLVRAELMQAISQVYTNLGEYGEASSLSDDALQLRTGALGEDHPAVADSLTALGDVHRRQSKFQRAEALHRRALAIRREQLGSEHPDTAQSLTRLAQLAYFAGDVEGARRTYQEALEIQIAALGAEDLAVAETLVNVGWLENAEGKLSVAEEALRNALRIREKKLGPEHHLVAETLEYLADNRIFSEIYGEAEALTQRAIGIWARVLDPTDLRSGSAMTKLGSIYRYQGEYEASVAALQRAIGVLAEAGGDRGYELGFAYLELGETYGATERWKEAAAALERCLAIYESVFGSDHPRTAQVLNNLGSMISDGGAPARAEPYLRRAVNIFRPLEGNTYWKGLTQWSLANSLRDQGKRGEAATWYRSAIILFERETREGGGFRALSELKADFAALSARDEPPSE